MFNVEFEEVTNQFCAEFDTVVHTGDATLGEKTITQNGVYNASADGYDGYSRVTANVPTGGDTPVIESLSVTPTTSQQTYNDSEVDGYKPVVVAAMPTGTEGTPTATKGAVSNHSVAVTPSVTNQAGYINGGTKTGTAVTVSASELDSGTKSITSNGSNQDVVGYAAVDVAVPNSYSAADEGKVVSSGALVAQTSDTVTTNDTYDTTLINSLTVNVSGGGGDRLDDFLGNEGNFASAYDITINSTVVTAYSFYYRPVKIARFPNATEIGQNMFDTCTSLEEVYIDSYVGANDVGTRRNPTYAFSGCTALKKVYAPNCTHFRFTTSNSTSLVSLDDVTLSPNLVLVADGAFRGSKITSFCYPKCNRMFNNVFRDCSLLTMVDLSNDTWSFEGQVFYNAASLTTLVIRSTTQRALNNISAFTGTPFASGGTGGTLYVPESLVSSYQSASNWSTILGYANNQIKSIESTHTDPNAPVDLTLYCADGTPLPT